MCGFVHLQNLKRKLGQQKFHLTDHLCATQIPFSHRLTFHSALVALREHMTPTNILLSLCVPITSYVSFSCSYVAPKILALDLFCLTQAGHPYPRVARQSTLACQGGCSELLLQIQLAVYLLPRVTSLGDLVFLLVSHSFARSGLPTESTGCLLLLVSPQTGQPVLLVYLRLQEAV